MPIKKSLMILIGLAGLVISLSLPLPLHAGEFDAAFQRGTQSYSDGRLEEALEFYRRAAALDPKNGPAHSNIGFILYQKGLYEEALKEYREAVRLKPDFFSGHSSLAYLLDYLGRREEALTVYTEAAKLMPKDPTVKLRRALVLRRLGRLADARTDVEEAIKLRSRFGYACAQRGILCLKEGKREQADAEFTKAGSVDPDWVVDAAGYGDDEIIGLAPEFGINFKARGKDGASPLMAAIANDQRAMVSLLLDKGADVNATADDGTTAFILAAGKGDLETVKLLLSRGASISARRANGGTAPMSAAARGHTEVIRILLERGADVNAADTKGATALMLAAERGHTETLKVLLAAKANPDIPDLSGSTALIRASHFGHAAAAAVLIERGAAVNAKNNQDWTALMGAAWSGQPEIAKLLIRAGADIRIKNKAGHTAADVCGRKGDEATFRIFKEAGAQESYDFANKEALVCGRFFFVEDGQEQSTYGMLSRPSPELYQFETGKVLNRVSLTGAFKEAVSENGAFCWKLRRGSYFFNRINRYGTSAPDNFVHPQTIFTVPYGSDAYYIGTLKIGLEINRKLLGDKGIKKVLSVEVAYDEDFKKLIIPLMPDPNAKMETVLMAHNPTFPKTMRPDSGFDFKTIAPLLNALVIPLMMMR